MTSDVFGDGAKKHRFFEEGVSPVAKNCQKGPSPMAIKGEKI